MHLRAFAIAAVLSSTSALAQPAKDGPLSGLAACRAVADPAARVACYDKAVDALSAATAAKEVVVLDRRQVRETKRGLFGFNIGRLPFFGDGDDGPESKQEAEIDTTVSSVRGSGYGKYQFTVEGGARWETTEAASTFSLRPGDRIKLQRGSLGGYFVKSARGKRVAAKRIN